jgi:2-hydroxy-3-keto-5-methylthiopentenyl-1-phosphate phosphatase
MSEVVNLVVLCDFDGTVTTIDTAEFVLARFAGGDFRTFDRLFERGEVTLEECLNRQFSLVKASKKQILEELKDKVVFRANFKKLAEFCSQRPIPLMIVSAGLDFVVEHFLRLNTCFGLVKVLVPTTVFGVNGINFTFPRLSDTASENFKQDVARRYRRQGKRVMYVGDGPADYPAIKDADYAFAIEGSKLAKLSESHGTTYESMTDFQQVIEAIRKIDTNLNRTS